ncbi:tripartite motif containing 11 [Chelydra serpentina]|uniref:Tripartite motif containing 11 n=1 Tax=Chelydra serpentina TaxID=8475 RepID=A0A8T1S0D7_CHESE|nr:tripartite motif containing 11 [Chelydra serpentina]
MAGSDLVQALQLQVTCSICTKYMEVPVMLDYGHNYCEDCISQHWDRVEEEEEPRQCPLCRRAFRQRSFRQNKSLANVMVIVQWFPSQDEAQDVRSTSSMLGAGGGAHEEGPAGAAGKTARTQCSRRGECPMAGWCRSVPRDLQGKAGGGPSGNGEGSHLSLEGMD